LQLRAEPERRGRAGFARRTACSAVECFILLSTQPSAIRRRRRRAAGPSRLELRRLSPNNQKSPHRSFGAAAPANAGCCPSVAKPKATNLRSKRPFKSCHNLFFPAPAPALATPPPLNPPGGCETGLAARCCRSGCCAIRPPPNPSCIKLLLPVASWPRSTESSQSLR